MKSKLKYGKHNKKLYKRSRRHTDAKFDRLISHVCNPEYLGSTLSRLDKNKTGLDGITRDQFDKILIPFIARRLKARKYEIKSKKRTYKVKGRFFKASNIGDKMVEKAFSSTLDAIYEPIFSDSSYGFRKNRSASDVHRRLNKTYTYTERGVLIKKDILQYFPSITRNHVKKALKRKISSKKFINLVLDIAFPGKRFKGLDQGSSLSNSLANIVGHEYLDKTLEIAKDRFYESYPRDIRIENFRYVDDIIIVIDSFDAHGHLENLYDEELKKNGFYINHDKADKADFGSLLEDHFDTHMRILGLDLEYQEFKVGDQNYEKSILCYPQEKSNEHLDYLFGFFIEEFLKLNPGNDFNLQSIEASHKTLFKLIKEIRRKYSFYLNADKASIMDFSQNLYTKIKNWYIKKGFKPKVAIEILNSSGIKDLTSIDWC